MVQGYAWATIKAQYVRPYYLPATFTAATLTVGLRVAAANFVFAEDPLSYLGCASMAGVMCMAFVWVLLDFTDDPPDSNNFSSPR